MLDALRKPLRKMVLEKESLKMLLAKSFIDDVIIAAETDARKLVLGLTPSEKTEDALTLLPLALSRFQSGGTVQRKRKIADALNKAGHYIV